MSTKTEPDIFRTCDSLRVISLLYSVVGYTYILGTIVNEVWTTGENLILSYFNLFLKLYVN